MSEALWNGVIALWFLGALICLLTVAIRVTLWAATQVGYWRLGRHLQRAMRGAQPGEAFLLAPSDAEVRIINGERADELRERAPWN